MYNEAETILKRRLSSGKGGNNFGAFPFFFHVRVEE